MTRAVAAEHTVGRARAHAELPVASLMLLLLRMALGGVFCVAAFFKLRDPQAFSEAIQAFRIVRSDGMVLFGTHTLPWIEMFAGIALVLGLWTREAAAILGALLLLFIGVIVVAILQGRAGMPCSCFGSYKLLCPGGVGWCKVFENAGLTVMAVVLAIAGGGRLAADSLLRK